MLKFVKLSHCVLAGLLLVSFGCVTVQMPQYLKDKNPYHKEFYVHYDKALSATIMALERLGWKVVKQSNPMVFEGDSVQSEATPRQVLLFTDMRQNGMLFGSRYATINVFLKENNEKIDVEIRYFSIFSTALKNFENYKNDELVKKIFDQIEKVIATP